MKSISEFEAPSGQADPPADAYVVTKEIALKALDRRMYSCHEMREYLRRKECPDAVISQVIERLVEVKLLDDEVFAHQWVQTRHRGRHLSARVLRMELVKKGIPDLLIEQAIDQLTRDDEEQAARAIAEARMRTLRGQSRAVIYRRLMSALQRRGFSGELCYAIVSEYLHDDGDSRSLPQA